MQIKSDWRLIRLGNKHAEYDLNDGETKIGRSVKSHIRTESEICSRVHCTLAIDANGKITLEDKSRNGIFVNRVRCKTAKLKDGDVFGLGCDDSVFELDIPNIDEFFVFKLQRKRVFSFDESPASPDAAQYIENYDHDSRMQQSHDDSNVNQLIEDMARHSFITAEPHSATKRHHPEQFVEGTPIADKKNRTAVEPSITSGKNVSTSSANVPSIEENRAPPQPSLNMSLNTSLNTSMNKYNVSAINNRNNTVSVIAAMREVITEIIEWKPDWLTSNEPEPPIAVDAKSIAPLLSDYSTYKTYEIGLVPLLKYELWANILHDHRTFKRDAFGAKKVSMCLENGNPAKRVIIRAQINIEVDSTKCNDLLLVEAKNCPKFFAFVTCETFDDATNTVQFVMEAPRKIMDQLGETTTILNVTPIANIRTGLKLFYALFHLKYSPFLDIVLHRKSSNPIEIMRKDYAYVGGLVLDNDQQEIVKTLYHRCMSNVPSLSVIEGLSGSGKTHVIAALTLQLLRSKEIKRPYKILALSGTHSGVSAITQKLEDIRSKLKGKHNLNFIRFPTHDTESLEKATVVCSTLADSINVKRAFHICIIDEAAQCTEPWTLTPLLYGIKTLILAGDLQQMPPIVASSICQEKEMAISFFKRFIQETSRETVNSGKSMFTLQTQYCMHPDIFHFPNKQFYRGHGKNGRVPRDDRLQLNAYNVFDLKFKHSVNDEAEFVVGVLKEVLKLANPNEYTYGIMTPNVDVRDKIRRIISGPPAIPNHTFDVNTYDTFQGKHKDIILISTAKEGKVFSGSALNLALTRAKNCLIICGHFASLVTVDAVWKNLRDDARQRHKFHSFAFDYTYGMISEKLQLHTD